MAPGVHDGDKPDDSGQEYPDFIRGYRKEAEFCGNAEEPGYLNHGGKYNPGTDRVVMIGLSVWMGMRCRKLSTIIDDAEAAAWGWCDTCHICC